MLPDEPVLEVPIVPELPVVPELVEEVGRVAQLWVVAEQVNPMPALQQPRCGGLQSTSGTQPSWHAPFPPQNQPAPPSWSAWHAVSVLQTLAPIRQVPLPPPSGSTGSQWLVPEMQSASLVQLPQKPETQPRLLQVAAVVQLVGWVQ